MSDKDQIDEHTNEEIIEEKLEKIKSKDSIEVISESIKPIKTNLVLLGIFLVIMVPLTIKEKRESMFND